MLGSCANLPFFTRRAENDISSRPLSHLARAQAVVFFKVPRKEIDVLVPDRPRDFRDPNVFISQQIRRRVQPQPCYICDG